MHLNTSSAKWRPFCPGGDELRLNVMLFPNQDFPDSKIHGANMGPIWDRQDADGPHVGPMNFFLSGLRIS